jgi:hypothetical protein
MNKKTIKMVKVEKKAVLHKNRGLVIKEKGREVKPPCGHLVPVPDDGANESNTPDPPQLMASAPLFINQATILNPSTIMPVPHAQRTKPMAFKQKQQTTHQSNCTALTNGWLQRTRKSWATGSK